MKLHIEMNKDTPEIGLQRTKWILAHSEKYCHAALT